MTVTLSYNFANTNLIKKADEIAFTLSNLIGGFTFLSNNISSRYMGIFFNHDFEVFKTIERIVPLRPGKLKNIVYDFGTIKQEYENLTETYIMPFNTNAVYYSLSREKTVEFWLDVKKTYDNREFGRYHDITEEDGKIIIKFTKKTDKREDKSGNRTEYELYIVLKPDTIKDLEKPDEWVRTEYSYDKKRNSSPWIRYPYKAVRLRFKNAVIAFGIDKEKAKLDADFVSENLETIKQELALRTEIANNIKDKETKTAFLCAQHSLNSLVNSIGHLQGIYAGLPWFFQFWSRDELISIKAIMLMKRTALAKEILLKHLNQINEFGRLRNKTPSFHDFNFADIRNIDKRNIKRIEKQSLGSADSIGWFFARFLDYLNIMQKNKKLDNEEKLVLYELRSKLHDSIFKQIENFGIKGLISNKADETWMDTSVAVSTALNQNPSQDSPAGKKDTRAGLRIEIQALFLRMYKLQEKIAELLHDRAGLNIAKTNQKNLIQKIKKHFWNGSILRDGSDDDTTRPNIFLAYYLCPEILNKKQWESCFDNVLEKLWLDWGGLSTIDQKNPLFCKEHTGENPKSYHRGDSWYWINNIAAIALCRLNKKKYKKFISAIADASKKDILELGIMGAGSEISSAEKQEPFGCWNQAWSSALFVELIHELYCRD